jgi:hypothetical protein
MKAQMDAENKALKEKLWTWRKEKFREIVQKYLFRVSRNNSFFAKYREISYREIFVTN